MKQKRKYIVIGSVLLTLLLLLGGAIWLLNRGETTEGEQVAKNVLGVEWYDPNGTEFTIDTVEEFYEFAQLSGHYDFAGQTIYLGADLTFNEGDPNEWQYTVPEYMWEGIFGFAGTFDGQGHTISGIYCMGSLYGGRGQQSRAYSTSMNYYTAALFRETYPECVIKNFKLVNSYFYGDLNAGQGCISSYGGGTFDSIYVDAIMYSQKYNTGGIIGNVTDKTSISNCWFDGELSIVGGYARYSGGIVGRVQEGIECTIEHCLVSGVLNNDLYMRGVNMGGLIGNTVASSKVIIKDSLVTGTLNNDWKVVGSAIGSIATRANVEISDVYVTKEAFNKVIGNISGNLTGSAIAFPKATLTGYGGYQWTTLDFENYWTIVEDGTPILKTFAENTPSLDGVERLVDTSWYDETQDTYVLNDRADLYGFAVKSYSTNFEGKTVTLGANITVNKGNATSWAKNAPEYPWLTIGSSSCKFAGTFDGKGKTISGLYLKTDESYQGMFGTTTETTVIKNFKLTNSYFESSNNSFGSIAGRGIGTFDSIYSSAIVVSSMSNIGGIVGQVTAGVTKINNCWFDGTVTIADGKTTSNRRAGGIVGSVYSQVTVTNCLNTGTIDASAYSAGEVSSSTGKVTKNVYPYAGGIVAFIKSTNKEYTSVISNCFNAGDILLYKDPEGVKSVNRYGSILGYVATKTTVENCYATTESSKKTTGSTSYVTGKVITYPEAKLSGYGGYQWTTLNFDKYWSVVISPDGTPILKKFASKSPSVAGVARMIDTSWYNEKESTYILYDLADLNGFSLLASTSNFEGKTVKLGSSIVVNSGNAADWATTAPSNEWTCIGSSSLPFAGTFDGQGHTISGIYVKTDDSYQGLFGTTAETAVIKNFKLTNSYFESSNNSFGSIAGRGVGTFDSIYSNAIVVSSMSNVGGLIGQVTAGVTKINNCWFDGTVKLSDGSTTSNRRVGGFVGVVYSQVTVTNSLNTGTVDVSAYSVGEVSSSTGKETKNVYPYAGGLVGYIKSTSEEYISVISNCFNEGDILVYKDPEKVKSVSRYGSIIGYIASSTELEECYATSESSNKTATASASKYLTGKVITYPEAQISGYGGYQWMTLDFDTTSGYWAVVTAPDSTPILRSFASTVPSLEGYAKIFDTSWYDENSTEPYQLSDKADLYGLSMLSDTTDFAGKTFVLTEDIVFDDNNWIPIGGSIAFAGTFDGKDPETNEIHKITGIRSVSDSANGLFAQTAEGSMICNLRIEDSYFEVTSSSKTPVGSVVGTLGGDLKNIYSKATVTSKAGKTGGLVGVVELASSTSTNKISECWYDGEVTVNSPGETTNNQGIGGLVGGVYVGATTMEDCINTGDVTATFAEYKYQVNKAIGGLVGYLIDSAATLSMEDVVMSGNLLVQYGTEGSYTVLTGGATNSETGRGVGQYVGYGTPTIKDAYCVESAQGYIFAKTVKGASSNYKNALTEQQLCSTQAYVATKDALDYYDEAKNPTGVWVIAEDGPRLKNFAEAAEAEDTSATDWFYGTENYDQGGNTFTISTVEELYTLGAIAQTYSFDGDTIMLLPDTEYKMNEGLATDWAKGENISELTTWTPVGSASLEFKGTFNGNGSTISGIYMTTDKANTGLFGAVRNATISNFRVENSFYQCTLVNGNAPMGSIVGYAYVGNISNVYSDAILYSTSKRVGGLVGYAGETDADSVVNITNCWFAGTIKVDYEDNEPQSGCIVGYGRRVVVDTCLSEGTITWNYLTEYSKNRNVTIGGLVGTIGSSVTIKHSISAADVYINVPNATGTLSQYGLVMGKGSNATIDRVYTLGTIYITSGNGNSDSKASYNASTVPDSVNNTFAKNDVYGTQASTKLTDLFFTEAGRTEFDGGTAYWAETDKLPIPQSLVKED